MLDTLRHLDFFNPMKIKEEVHIIGVGAVGSHIAHALVRLGVQRLHIRDFDKIDTHNNPKQKFKKKKKRKKKK